MKTLTIKQPYAEAIFQGIKHHIARKSDSKHRGWLAIHAAKAKVDNTDRMVFEHLVGNVSSKRSLLERYSSTSINYNYGKIIGIVEVLDCVETTDVSREDRLLDDWSGSTHMFVLGKATRIDPVEISGKRGLWEWNDGSINNQDAKNELPEKQGSMDGAIVEKDSNAME